MSRNKTQKNKAQLNHSMSSEFYGCLTPCSFPQLHSSLENQQLHNYSVREEQQPHKMNERVWNSPESYLQRIFTIWAVQKFHEKLHSQCLSSSDLSENSLCVDSPVTKAFFLKKKNQWQFNIAAWGSNTSWSYQINWSKKPRKNMGGWDVYKEFCKGLTYSWESRRAPPCAGLCVHPGKPEKVLVFHLWLI